MNNENNDNGTTSEGSAQEAVEFLNGTDGKLAELHSQYQPEEEDSIAVTIEPIVDSTVAVDDSVIGVTTEEPVAYQAPQEEKHHFQYEPPYNTPSTEKDYPYVTMHAPNVRLAIQDHIENLKKFQEVIKNAEANDESLKHFNDLVNSYQAMFTTIYDKGEFNNAFDREDSDFSQTVEGDGGRKIRISNPKFSLDKNSDRLEGLNAIRYLSSVTGVSSVSRIPLWHSGIVITVDSFKERELLDLNQALIRQRLDLGNNTKGASFSGDDVYTTAIIIDFILDHVIDCNLIVERDSYVEILRDLILVNDIDSMITGALSAIYPKGYPLFHQCFNVPLGLCDYTITAERTAEMGDFKPDSLLDFKKVLWVDKSKLNVAARQHMSAIKATHTVQQVKEYQMEVNKLGSFAQGAELFKNDDIIVKMHYKIPTLRQYAEACSQWCTTVTEMVDKTLALDTGMNEEDRAGKRNEALTQYALTLDLLKQSNWIDYVETIDGEGMVRRINEEKTIANAMEVFSRLENFNQNFNESVQKFKEETKISLSGLPNFECPKCHSGQVPAGAKYPSLIPMNMTSYFFTLMEWRNLTRFAGIMT